MTASASARGATRPLEIVGGVLVAVSTILAIVGAAVLIFANPVWIRFGQEQADSAAWTGWTQDRVTEVTNAVLHDLVIGPPDFAMAVDGTPVFDARERQHERDVRTVFGLFGAAVLGGVAVLVVAAARSRGRSWFWRAVAVGAAALGAAVVALGIVLAVAFDPAFELFHSLFFPAGSYDFDPRTARLVQLFPEAFWFLTSISLGVVLVVLSAAVAAYALRRIRGMAAAEGGAGVSATPAPEADSEAPS